MSEFTTSTEQPLKLRYARRDGKHIVTLTGEKEKLLYSGDNIGDAMAEYTHIKKHYEDRAISLATEFQPTARAKAWAAAQREQALRDQTNQGRVQ